MKVYFVDHEFMADMKVYVVDHEFLADMKAFQVHHEFEANAKVYRVDHEFMADTKLFLVPYEFMVGGVGTVGAGAGALSVRRKGFLDFHPTAWAAHFGAWAAIGMIGTVPSAFLGFKVLKLSDDKAPFIFGFPWAVPPVLLLVGTVIAFVRWRAYSKSLK